MSVIDPEDQSRRSPTGSYFTPEIAWAQTQGQLNWYRAMPDRFIATDGLAGEVVQPVLYLVGTRDLPVFTRGEVRDLQSRFVTGPYRQIELDASHWLIQERPREVVAAVMNHLSAQASEGGAGGRGR